MIETFLSDETATEAWAKYLADSIVYPPLIIGLRGEIGAGKTTFVRALLRHMGYQGNIKSPTYSIVETYSIQTLMAHHFDLYRVSEEELEYVGFRDYFTSDAVCCIEWPEKASNLLELLDLCLSLEIRNEGRMLMLESKTLKGQAILQQLKDEP